MKPFEALDVVDKLWTLQILSLECLVSLWDDMCLHINVSAVQDVHQYARQATGTILDGVDHFSALADDTRLLHEFDAVVGSLSQMPKPSNRN